MGALFIEIARDCPAKVRISNPVRGIGWHRKIASCQLVFTLRAGLDAGKLAGNRKFDRLIVADFEMQARVVLNRAPVTTIKTITADEIKRASNVTFAAPRQHQ